MRMLLWGIFVLCWGLGLGCLIAGAPEEIAYGLLALGFLPAIGAAYIGAYGPRTIPEAKKSQSRH